MSNTLPWIFNDNHPKHVMFNNIQLFFFFDKYISALEVKRLSEVLSAFWIMQKRWFPALNDY